MAAESVVGIRLTLDGAQQAEAGLKRVAVGVNQVGMSAKETANALRGVPAQLTDIFVSLQGGQAPLTVLLQQGGQLTNMFHGVVPAAKALASTVMGYVNPFTLAAGAVAGLAVAYEQGRAESVALEMALVKSNNIIGVTTGQLNAMAAALGHDGFTRGAAAEALTTLAGSGKVAAADLQRLTGVALDMDKYLGQSVADTNKVFSDLANEPSKAVLKLNESMHFLTLQQYEHIKALEDQGRKTDAARVAQQAYADAVQPAIDKTKENLGYLERAWGGVAGAAKGAWDAMMSIGRAETVEDKAKNLRAELAKVEADIKYYRGYDPGAVPGEERRAAALREQIRIIDSQLGATVRLAAEKARLQQIEEAGIAAASKVLATQDKGLSKQEQMNKALAAYRAEISAVRAANPTSTLLEPAAIARGEQAIRDQFKETAKATKERGDAFAADRDAAKVWAQTWEEAGKLIDDATGKTLGLNKAQELLLQYLTSPAYQTNTEAMRQLVLQRLYAADAAMKDAEATKQEKLAAEEAAKALSNWAADREKETKALDDQIKTRESEITALGLSADATTQLSAAKLEQAAAEKEAYAAALQAASFYAGEYRDAYSQAAADALEQAAKLRQLAGLELEKGAKQAAVDARDEWKKSVEKIDDIFRQGFADMINGSKSSWESFTKSLTTTFKTAVADQIYKMLAQPFAVKLVVAITGVSGASAASATGLTGSGGGFGVGDAYSAYKNGSALYTLGSQVWNGTMSMANAGGTYLANATGTGLDGLLATNGAYGTAAGATGGMASYLPGIGGALGAFGFGQQYGVAGGVLGGIGSTALAGGIGGLAAGTGFGAGAMGALGALGPWGWAAIGAGTLLGGLFGKDDPTYKFTTNSSQAPTKKVFEDGVYVQSVYGNIGMADHYSNGIKADKYKDTFQSIANLDAGIAAGLTAAQNAAIKKALDGYTGGKMGTVEAYVQGRLQIITNTLGGAIDALADQFKGTTEQFAGYVTQLVQVQALIPSITFLNRALDGTSTAATQTAMALSTAFGGVSGANSVLGSFVQNYYTDAEKLTMQTASLAEVFQAAGLTMPHTTQEFRSLVEAQDLTTDAGRKSYVALMAVSGAFYDLTQQAKSAAGALGADFFSTAADYQYYQTTGQVPARVPAFAAGGMHGGGWAVVGEQGPELVNLSPARVYSNSDSKGLLDTSGLARELAALRADARINAATLVDVLKRVDKLFNRWDMNGMPETRSVAV